MIISARPFVLRIYCSLIKTSDNNGLSGPVDLTDGDGIASSLKIGTKASSEGIVVTGPISNTGGDISSGANVSGDVITGTTCITTTGPLLAATTAGNKVGIGTTDPSQPLHILDGNAPSGTPFANGSMLIAGHSTIGLNFYGNDSSAQHIYFGSPSDNTGASIRYEYDGFGSSVPELLIGTSTSNGIVTFGTGTGAEKMRIDASGNVGIGTAAPSQKLDVIGRIRSSFNSGDYFEIGSSDSGGFVLGFSGGTEVVNIRTYGDSYFNGGKVGIGTNNPKSILEIAANNPVINFKDTSAGTDLSYRYIQNVDGKMLFAKANDAYNSFTTHMAITTDGSVGIGTPSPSAGLHVLNSTEPTVLFESTNAGSSGSRLQLYHNSATPADNDIISNIQMAGEDSSGAKRYAALIQTRAADVNASSVDGDIRFLTYKSDTPSEVMRITHDKTVLIEDGLVGAPALSFINDTNTGMWRPGSDQLRLATGGTDAIIIDSSQNVTIGNGGSGGGATIRPGGQTSVYALTVDRSGSSGNSVDIWDNNSNSVIIGATNSEQTLAIKAGGNVGIGTTGPEGKLHIYTGNSGGSVNSSADELVIEAASSGGIQFLNGSTASGYILFGDSGGNSTGQIRYLHSDDSMRLTTANVERLIIDSSGNVGIGTTNPSTDFSVKEHLLFNDTTRLLTISNNTNTGGINLDGGNSRLYFSGYRALEGSNSGTTLTVGEGYGTTKISSVLNVVDHETILSPDQGSSGGVASRALTIENINDSNWTANALTAYNSTTGYDIRDRASYSFFARPTSGNIITFASETANQSTLHRFVNLNSSATEPLYRWDFYQYDGSGTGNDNFKVPDKLFQIRVREGASEVEKFTIKGNGKVGIGTNNPDTIFHVQGTSFSTFERNTSCTNVSRTAADFDHTTSDDMTEGFGSQIRFTGGDNGCTETTFAMLRGLRGSADSEGEFMKKSGFEIDLSAAGLGNRLTRFSMLIDNGLIMEIFDENGPGLEVSKASNVLDKI